jgi:hypothetical protein
MSTVRKWKDDAFISFDFFDFWSFECTISQDFEVYKFEKIY